MVLTVSVTKGVATCESKQTTISTLLGYLFSIKMCLELGLGLKTLSEQTLSCWLTVFVTKGVAT